MNKDYIKIKTKSLNLDKLRENYDVNSDEELQLTVVAYTLNSSNWINTRMPYYNVNSEKGKLHFEAFIFEYISFNAKKLKIACIKSIDNKTIYNSKNFDISELLVDN